MVSKNNICKLTSLFMLSMASGFAHAAEPSTQDSSTFAPPTTNPNAIFIIASGSGAFSNQATITFSTNVGCPTGFTPYITVTPYTVQVGVTGELVVGFSACVQSIVPSATNVVVSLINTKYVQTYQDTSKGGWIGEDRGAWTVWSTTRMPKTSYLSNTIEQGPINTGHYLWSQYCYPSGMTPPAYTCP